MKATYDKSKIMKNAWYLKKVQPGKSLGGLPAQGLAQREVGDADREDREPPDGAAEGHGVPPRTAESADRFLWCPRNVLW